MTDTTTTEPAVEETSGRLAALVDHRVLFEPSVNRCQLRPGSRVEIDRLTTGGVEIRVAHPKPSAKLPLHTPHRRGNRDLRLAAVLQRGVRTLWRRDGLHPAD